MPIYQSVGEAITYEEQTAAQAAAHEAIVRVARIIAQGAPAPVVAAVEKAVEATQPGHGPNYPQYERICAAIRQGAEACDFPSAAYEVVAAVESVYDAYVDSSRCQHCGCIGGH